MRRRGGGGEGKGQQEDIVTGGNCLRDENEAGRSSTNCSAHAQEQEDELTD